MTIPLYDRNFRLPLELVQYSGSEYYLYGNKISEKDFLEFKNDPDKPNEITSNGVRIWKNKKGQAYRGNDKPAIVSPGIYEKWCKDGVSHRETGPAVIYVSGEKKWYIEGNLHRVDGPAIERPDGSKEWYENGKWIKSLHKDGTLIYLKDGMKHRLNGPAVLYANGKEEFWVNGHKQYFGNQKEINADNFWLIIFAAELKNKVYLKEFGVCLNEKA